MWRYEMSLGKESGGFLLENILSVFSEYGVESTKQIAKDVIESTAGEIVAEVGLDLIGSMIPGIGSLYTTFKQKKAIQNISIGLEEFMKHQEEINQNLIAQTSENKAKLDEILSIALEQIANTHQQEKIEYIVNGYSELTKVVNINFDMAHLYFDTLNRLTLLDISCLKLSYSTWDLTKDNTLAYENILDEFDINYEQYTAVRNNLERYGLLQNQYEKMVKKDMESINKSVNEVITSLNATQSAIKDPKKKINPIKMNNKLKPKARDKLIVSGFGREFIEFFIKNIE